MSEITTTARHRWRPTQFDALRTAWKTVGTLPNGPEKNARLRQIIDAFKSDVFSRGSIELPTLESAAKDPHVGGLRGRILTLADVPTIREAAAYIARQLENPELESMLFRAHASATESERPRFDRIVRGLALLIDFACSSADYGNASFGFSPDCAASSRRGHQRRNFRAHESAARIHRTREELASALGDALKASAPLEAATKVFMSAFLEQVGVPAKEANSWHPDPDAIIEALSEELFAPLRALNERTRIDVMRFRPYAGYSSRTVEHMLAVVRGLTRAIAEGGLDGYESWRRAIDATDAAMLADHGGDALLVECRRRLNNAEQISVLPAEARAKHFDRFRTATQTPRGTVSAHDVTGGERFWATTIGGPSHSFQMMTACMLPLVGNLRTDAIIVDHEAFPIGSAARAYLVLLKDVQGRAVYYLAPPQLDFDFPPYSCKEQERTRADVRDQLVRHAVARAQHVGIPLVLEGSYLSPRIRARIDEDGKSIVEVKPLEHELVFSPSAVGNEATSDLLDCHDGEQLATKVTAVVRRQRFYEVTSTAQSV